MEPSDLSAEPFSFLIDFLTVFILELTGYSSFYFQGRSTSPKQRDSYNSGYEISDPPDPPPLE